MAGMSFLRARSPVTPNMTSTQGPATRGIRRSRGSRSGLCGSSAPVSSAMTPGLAGARPSGSPGSAVTWNLRGVHYEPVWSSASEPHIRSDRVEQLIPRCLELRDALVLENLHHVVVADAERFEVLEDLAGRVVSTVHRVAAQLAVVRGGLDGRLGHGVHRLGDHEFDDVHGVGEARVLSGGRGPQRPLEF